MSLFMVGGEGLIEIGTKSLSLLFYFFEGLPYWNPVSIYGANLQDGTELCTKESLKDFLSFLSR